MKIYLGFINCFFLVSNALLTLAEAQPNPGSVNPPLKHTNSNVATTDSKEVNELKRLIKEKDRKIENLNKALLQQVDANKDLENTFINQRKLLLDEQQKIVEELIEKRQRLLTFVSGNAHSSERERMLAQELEFSINKEKEAKKKIVELREAQIALQDLVRAHKLLKKQFADKENELAAMESQKQALETQLKTAAIDLEKQSVTQSNGLLEITKKDNRIEQLQRELKQANDIVKALQLEVEVKKQLEAKIEGLDRDLTEAKNLIMLKETELKILNESGAINTGRAPNMRSNPAPVANQNANQYPSYPLQQRRLVPNVKPTSTADLNSDVLVVTVIDDKVNLRSGPGNEHAPVMQVQRGSRLTVEARQGDWYSVITPTGSRAFVHKDFVTTGQVLSNPAKPIARNLPVPGENISSNQNSNPEEAKRAFEALRSNFSKPQ